jgi:hypothetical protein
MVGQKSMAIAYFWVCKERHFRAVPHNVAMNTLHRFNEILRGLIGWKEKLKIRYPASMASPYETAYVCPADINVPHDAA